MLTDDEIREICDRYELIYNITDNVVFIRSACGRWNIFLRGDEVVNLRHENYRWAKGQHRKHTRNLLKIITTRNWKQRTFVRWSVIL